MHLIGDVFVAFVAVLKVLVKSQVSLKSSFFLFFSPSSAPSFLAPILLSRACNVTLKKTESVRKISGCPETFKIPVKSKKTGRTFC